VTSRGNSVSLRALESWRGYGLRVDNFKGNGGIVEDGFGEVNANTRAVATASAYVLNSATGVMFPSTSIAPPYIGVSIEYLKKNFRDAQQHRDCCTG